MADVLHPLIDYLLYNTFIVKLFVTAHAGKLTSLVAEVVNTRVETTFP